MRGRKIAFNDSPRSEGEALLRAILRTGTSLSEIAAKADASKPAVGAWAHGRTVPEGARRMLLEEHCGIAADAWTVRPGELDEDARPPAGLLGRLATTPVPVVSTGPAQANPVPTDAAHRGLEEARRGLDLSRAWLERCEVTATPTEYGRALESYRKATELFAKVNKELNASDESKFLKSPRWRSILNTLVDALRPVPGALEALSRTIKEIEAP